MCHLKLTCQINAWNKRLEQKSNSKVCILVAENDCAATIFTYVEEILKLQLITITLHWTRWSRLVACRISVSHVNQRCSFLIYCSHSRINSARDETRKDKRIFQNCFFFSTHESSLFHFVSFLVFLTLSSTLMSVYSFLLDRQLTRRDKKRQANLSELFLLLNLRKLSFSFRLFFDFLDFELSIYVWRYKSNILFVLCQHALKLWVRNMHSECSIVSSFEAYIEVERITFRRM